MPNYYTDGDGFLIETFHQFAVYDFQRKALQPDKSIQHISNNAIGTLKEFLSFFRVVYTRIYY